MIPRSQTKDVMNPAADSSRILGIKIIKDPATRARVVTAETEAVLRAAFRRQVISLNPSARASDTSSFRRS